MTGMTAWQASGGGGAGEQWMQVVGVAYIAKQSVRTSPAQMGPLKRLFTCVHNHRMLRAHVTGPDGAIETRS